MPRPNPASPDPDRPFGWEDDDQAPSISIRPLSQADLRGLIADLQAAENDEPAQAVLDHWMTPENPAPIAPPPTVPTVGRPGGSAMAQYRRRRAAELAAWSRTLAWRVASVLAAGAGAGLLAGRVVPRLILAAAIVAAVGVGFMLRFRPSPDTQAWRTGAEGEGRTARLLGRLERHGWIVLHDLAVPGSRANLDHLVIGPGGVFVVDSKQYRGRLQLAPDGSLWHGRYPLAPALRAARFEADQAAHLLASNATAVVAVHGTPVPWGTLTVDGVAVVSAGHLPDLLRAQPPVLAPQRATWLAERARSRFHPAA
jgi:hypothetical protein